MEDIIRAILHINEEIEEIKRQIEILKKRPDVLFKEYWMDGHDVSQALHISERHLRILRLQGQLPFSRLHKKIYYRVSDIKSRLEKNRIETHKPIQP